MINPKHRAFALLGGAVLWLAAPASFAGPGSAATTTANAPRAAFAATHPTFRPPGNRHVRHHGRAPLGAFWPTTGSFYAPTDDQALAGAPQFQPSDIHYTYSYDVPWDWAHRYPPAVAPADRPYVASCGPEIVTVPGRRGGEHTVNVFRCY